MSIRSESGTKTLGKLWHWGTCCDRVTWGEYVWVKGISQLGQLGRVNRMGGITIFRRCTIHTIVWIEWTDAPWVCILYNSARNRLLSYATRVYMIMDPSTELVDVSQLSAARNNVTERAYESNDLWANHLIALYLFHTDLLPARQIKLDWLQWFSIS